MRLPRMQFTVRWMMVAVAVTAVFALIYRNIRAASETVVSAAFVLWMFAPVMVSSVVVYLPLPLARRLGLGAGWVAAVAAAVGGLIVAAEVIHEVRRPKDELAAPALGPLLLCVAVVWL